jgi:hypothetical protein
VNVTATGIEIESVAAAGKIKGEKGEGAARSPDSVGQPGLPKPSM